MKAKVIATLVLALAVACKSDPKPTGATAKKEPEPQTTIVMPTASAPPAPAGWVPFLYRIEGAHPSYLLGTIHVGNAQTAKFPTAIDKDFAAADELVTEVVMDSPDKDAFVKGTILQGKTLDQVLSPPDWADTQAVLGGAGIPKAAYSRMKPWAIAVQISLVDHAADLQNGIDLRLTSRARTEKKPVSALESFNDQLQVFDAMSSADQEEMVHEALEQRSKAKKEGRDPIGDLLSAYVSGDEERVIAQLDKDYDPKNPTDVRLRQRLVLDRNVTMSDRIRDKTKGGARSYFFAVGAAHVVGPDGIVARLRAAGLEVAREK